MDELELFVGWLWSCAQIAEEESPGDKLGEVRVKGGRVPPNKPCSS